MPLINECRLRLRRTSGRIYMALTMDDRQGAKNRLTGKVRSLEKKLGRKLKS
jgi:uncharacterized protein YqgV (UPF0045/DUF77 family)